MVAVLSSMLASSLGFSIGLQPTTRPLLPGGRFAEPPNVATTSPGLSDGEETPLNRGRVLSARAPAPVMQNELREFNKMDKDGGGSIDFEEFTDIQKSTTGTKLTREELRTLFDRFDADGSGSIDLQEYIQAKGAIDSGKKTVPLTGDTLQAGLKMRCDMSGASYAIYWANQKGKLKIVDSYKSANYKQELAGRGVLESFADASKPFALDAKGQGPIAQVLRNGEPLLIQNVGESNLARRCSYPPLPLPLPLPPAACPLPPAPCPPCPCPCSSFSTPALPVPCAVASRTPTPPKLTPHRPTFVSRELALQYGINAIAFGAYEDGVIEYGTTTASDTQWARLPEVTIYIYMSTPQPPLRTWPSPPLHLPTPTPSHDPRMTPHMTPT